MCVCLKQGEGMLVRIYEIEVRQQFLVVFDNVWVMYVLFGGVCLTGREVEITSENEWRVV